MGLKSAKKDWKGCGEEKKAYASVLPGPGYRKKVMMVSLDAMLLRTFSNRRSDAKESKSPQVMLQSFMAQTWLSMLNLPRTPTDVYGLSLIHI